MPVNREVFVLDSGQAATLAMDADASLGQRVWAVVSMQLVDENTGKAPGGQVSIQAQEDGLQPRAADGGIAGLVAIPFNRFPNLKNQPYSVHMTVDVRGYLRMQLEANIPQAPGFPASFTPADLGKVNLHTYPTVIRGRVVKMSAAGVITPLAGATVELAGFWPAAPLLPNTPPASPPNLLAVTPPLYASRPTGGNLRRRNLSAVAGQDKTLQEFAAAGSLAVHLSDRVGAAAGGFLSIEPGSPERTEIMQIDTVTGASTATQPARVTFKHPLAFSHPRDALVRPVTLAAPGFNKSITRAAYAGDASVYLNNLTSVVAAVVEISGGAPPPEYHSFSFYTAASNADGYYRLPPIHRASMLLLRAHQPTLTDVEVNFAPDYGLPENQVDFVFKQ